MYYFEYFFLKCNVLRSILFLCNVMYYTVSVYYPLQSFNTYLE